MVYSTRQFVVCLSMCHFVLVFFSPFSIAIISLGEVRVNLSAFRTFVRFVLVWICRFPLPLEVWEGLRFVIVELPGLFSYLFLSFPILEFHQVASIVFERFLIIDRKRGMLRTRQPDTIWAPARPPSACPTTRHHSNNQICFPL